MTTRKQPKTYRFADFKSEARKDIEPTPPFTIGDVEPPIVITAPTDLERTIALAELVGPNGEFEIRDLRAILANLCGDAFPEVWELFRKEHTTVMIGLAGALLLHFKADIDGEAATVPGGSAAS